MIILYSSFFTLKLQFIKIQMCAHAGEERKRHTEREKKKKKKKIENSKMRTKITSEHEQ